MKIVKSLMPYIVIVIVVILIRSVIVTPVKVNGSSMYPTLDGGEIMFLNKLAKLKRFDIVVLQIDRENEDLIKRIIGLPGEKVKILNNKIYINDEVLEDKYGFGETNDMDEITLADDEYLVLGDNRKISLDSRVFGAVKEDAIKGTADFVMYPFKNFGKVE